LGHFYLVISEFFSITSLSAAMPAKVMPGTLVIIIFRGQISFEGADIEAKALLAAAMPAKVVMSAEP
jgi:hypothetical protein